MKYARFINENEIEELTNNYVVMDGRVYTNPINHPSKPLEKLGYKPLVIDEMPTYDSENQKVIRKYKVINDVIHRSWEVLDLTEQEKEEMRKMRQSLDVEENETR